MRPRHLRPLLTACLLRQRILSVVRLRHLHIRDTQDMRYGDRDLFPWLRLYPLGLFLNIAHISWFCMLWFSPRQKRARKRRREPRFFSWRPQKQSRCGDSNLGVFACSNTTILLSAIPDPGEGQGLRSPETVYL